MVFFCCVCVGVVSVVVRGCVVARSVCFVCVAVFVWYGLRGLYCCMLFCCGVVGFVCLWCLLFVLVVVFVRGVCCVLCCVVACCVLWVVVCAGCWCVLCFVLCVCCGVVLCLVFGVLLFVFMCVRCVA